MDSRAEFREYTLPPAPTWWGRGQGDQGIKPRLWKGWTAPSWELEASLLDKGHLSIFLAGAMPSLATGLAVVLKPSQQRASGWPLRKNQSLGGSWRPRVL